MIDLVTAIRGIDRDQPEAKCHRCDEPFEGRSVIFFLSNPVPSAHPPGEVVLQICAPCFQVKFENWEKIAAHLREFQP